jgi:hypothetical protein
MISFGRFVLWKRCSRSEGYTTYIFGEIYFHHQALPHISVHGTSVLWPGLFGKYPNATKTLRDLENGAHKVRATGNMPDGGQTSSSSSDDTNSALLTHFIQLFPNYKFQNCYEFTS